MLRQEVSLDGKDVPYLYGVDVTEELVGALADLAATADLVLLVTDREVAVHAEPVARGLAEAVRVALFTVDAAEQRKTLSLVEDIVEFAVGQGASRSTVVVAMGGGMVGNVAGLAAGLLFRGVRLVHLPTTPIAAFDSVLSVKQAVNLSGGKNLCGTYHVPSLIACDLRWLTSVPRGLMLTGLAEMAKNVLAVVPDRRPALERALGRLADEPAAALLELLAIGCDAKAPYLRTDPRERREALVFEYGHTMGHALEFVSQGGIGHGEAIAWGMLVAAEVSHGLGHLGHDDLALHRQVVGRLRLPPAAAGPGGLDRERIRAVLARDNKRGYLPCAPDEVPMVLLESAGRVVTGDRGLPLVPVPVDLAMSALEAVVGAAPGATLVEAGPARERLGAV
ncbi:iron-containing alcohol dehydrogenase [Streptomyces sp. UH6]|uniref:3-dehydroquinate synthase family protein n=1 Tax=Streptomyces sp. UH6 TaxID=2748379 RepID=UPI0015D48C5F|nr:iron-containing alcohol dehydrogenase [Streptomyces sp. UH6]NYV74572.1 iron-containing alcohol dehydrogenase [Streptomyces sp. UH6]